MRNCSYKKTVSTSCHAAKLNACIRSSKYLSNPLLPATISFIPRIILRKASLDDPDIQSLVARMVEMRPPPTERDRLEKAFALIDEANAADPQKVMVDGINRPYRLVYSEWVTDRVRALDPNSPDELFILARGKNIESWRLAEIKRDDYSPNTAGQRQWEMDRKKWLASRLTGIMEKVGYGAASISLVESVMMERDIPDPSRVRRFDLQGPLGTINYALLEQVKMVQTLRDAEALVFLEKNFRSMFEVMKPEEVMETVERETSKMSQQGMALALKMNWSAVERRALTRSLPSPLNFVGIMSDVEAVAAASTHPGDWRTRGFDYD